MTKPEFNPSHQNTGTNSHTQPYQSRYRWVMLALLWFSCTVFGVVIRAVAPLVTPIVEDLNISYSQMGIILGAWPLTYVVFALIGGAIMDRWGLRRYIFVGLIFIGLSATLRYFANNFATMFFFVALFGIGGPAISVGFPKAISIWFSEEERGKAIGIYMTGTSIGGLIALSLTNSVVMPLTGDSWRLAFVIYGSLAFIAAILWFVLAKDVKSQEAGAATNIIRVFRDLISVRSVQLILIMGLLSFAIIHGFTNWLPKILETGGLTPSVAGFAASIPSIVSIPSLLFIPRIVPIKRRKYAIAIGYIGLAISMWIIIISQGIPLISGLVLLGATYIFGLPIMILLLMAIPEVGPRYMGSAGGMFFCVAELGGFFGPSLVGAVVDLTGGFLVGTGIFVGLAITISVIALSLKL